MEGGVRRIHIIYFLSRKGRIEHPHLIRVHHVSQNGIHLSDVKRWLAELRGKELPESFAWSYKRRYRTGYVWQDLVDEDLISPISDNEYVLKGSEISSNSITDSTEIGLDQNLASLEEVEKHQQTTISISPKTTPIFSPEASTPTENSINLDEERKLLETNNHEIMEEANVDESDIGSSSFSTRLNIRNEKKKNKNNSGCVSPRSKTSFNVVRKLFNCRVVETNDKTMVKLNKRKCNKDFCGDGTNILQDEQSSESINKSEGLEKDLLSSWKQQRCPSARKSCDGVKRSDSTRSQSKSPKPHRPINGPNCSQCGKMFKPEKMHKHMQSCSGRRSFGKGSSVFAAAAAAKPDHDTSRRSMNYSTSQELLSSYYLN